jgi:signal transduction histidine kinase
VNFARLGAGSYRLRVRAVDGEGRTSPASASLEFRVIPPVWRRWWFLTLAAAAVAAATLTLHHLRVRHILAMERLRRQVALDLHDEIGSGLTEIAMMSEVAKREMGPPGAALLGETANLARSLRSSMSDIVWAIDPRRDHLNDLLQRMRQSSFHLLEGSGIEVEFHVPDERRILAMELAPHWRRHFLLIFKEALANVARHAQASRVRIGVAADSRELRLTVQDNGRGFDPEAVPNGHGLHSLRTRAAEMKGVVDIDSAPGRGTTVSMTVRLGP